MSKKYKKKLELEEAVKQVPTANDCPNPQCGTHFYGSTCARESHMKLYPDHFKQNQTKQPEKSEAIQVDLKPKIKRSNKKDSQD
jgi:hypothetical protein